MLAGAREPNRQLLIASVRNPAGTPHPRKQPHLRCGWRGEALRQGTPGKWPRCLHPRAPAIHSRTRLPSATQSLDPSTLSAAIGPAKLIKISFLPMLLAVCVESFRWYQESTGGGVCTGSRDIVTIKLECQSPINEVGRSAQSTILAYKLHSELGKQEAKL